MAQRTAGFLPGSGVRNDTCYPDKGEPKELYISWLATALEIRLWITKRFPEGSSLRIGPSS
eukprot:2824045-Heterocapsa_arctica.AAC.1